MQNTDRADTLPDRRIAWALFLGVFAVYGATLCRTIYTGDDGDFITAMATGGTPHPTGYPLFCLLGRLFLTLVPLGEPALRINILTALCGAGAVAMFYRFAALLVPQRFWAATAALILAFSPTLWQQSLSCEVYALTCLFLATLLYLATLWQTAPDDTRLLRLLTLTYGLALTNHLTIALFFPGFLVFVLATRRTLWREGCVLLSLVGLFLLPLLLYAYLPLAALAHPPVYWGSPSHFKTFWAHITGQQYRNLMFIGTGLVLRHTREYGGYLWAQFGLWFLWLVPIGAITLWRQRRALCLLLAYIWVADVAYAANYNIFDIYVYYLPSYFVAATFLAVGAARAMGWVWDRLRLTHSARAHYSTLVGIVALALPLVQMSLHYVETDKSRNFLETDFAGNILKSAPQNSIIVTGSNITFTLWYQRFGLGIRPDVTHVNWITMHGLFAFDAWYYEHLKRMYPDIRNTYPSHVANGRQASSNEFLLTMLRRALARGVPVIVIPDEHNDDIAMDRAGRSFRQQRRAAFDTVPWGVGERLYLKGQAPPDAIVAAENQRLWASFSTRGLFTGWAHADPLQEHISFRYADAGVALGALAERAGRFDVADVAYERSRRLYRIAAADAGRQRCARALARQASR